MIKAAIFDLDGTIADTSLGIISSYKEAARYAGVDGLSEKDYLNAIGGSLPDNIRRLFGIDGDVQSIVDVYRNHYSKEGFLQSRIYPGIKGVLQKLCDSNVKIGIATMKADIFAKKMVDMWGIKSFCTSIHGVDSRDNQLKSDLILSCLKDMDTDPQNAVVIGDTKDDCAGSEICGTSFIAVTYGFGYGRKYDVPSNVEYASEAYDLIRIIESIDQMAHNK